MAAVQAAVRQVAKDASVYGVTTLEDRLGTLSAQRRFQTSLLLAFAGIALALASVGIYGADALFGRDTQARGIGIRLAVRARSRCDCPDDSSRGFEFSLIGLVVGLVGAAWLGQLLSGLVFGVAPSDPPTFVAVPVLLTSVAAAACYLPARRAARIDAVAALRYDEPEGSATKSTLQVPIRNKFRWFSIKLKWAGSVSGSPEKT